MDNWARYVLLIAAALLIGLSASQPAAAQSEAEYVAARDAIWAMEQEIYKRRGQGDLSYYVANSSDNYKGWPPYTKAPADLTNLKKMAEGMVGLNKEQLEMELADFALSGDTAVIYYHTHRTRMPNGDPADQRYSICHVWTRENGSWKLVGAMGREKGRGE